MVRAKLQGTLKRASSPGKAEELDLAFADETARETVRLTNHVITDDQGRFEFDHVPPGRLQISYREYVPSKAVRSWANLPLETVTLKRAQTLEINIIAPERVATLGFKTGIMMGQAALQSGIQLHGQVLLPNRKPAGGVQVALKANSRYLLSLGKGNLQGGYSYDGLMVYADPNGEFTLPMCERADGVIAVNKEGFAGVSLEDFNKSSKLQLQAWARIEGTLHIGHRLATNETVLLHESPFASGSLPDDMREFEVQTDNHGHFEITYVPPGQRGLYRVVLLKNGTREQQSLGEFNIEPGETRVLNLGGTGERITGKLKLENSDTNVNWQGIMPYLSTTQSSIGPEETIGKRTMDEWIAYTRTEEYKAKTRIAMKDYHTYPVIISADGSFVCDDVPPGKYEISAREWINPMDPRHFRQPNYYWHREVTVPEVVDKSSDQPVDLGTVELELKSFKMP